MQFCWPRNVDAIVSHLIFSTQGPTFGFSLAKSVWRILLTVDWKSSQFARFGDFADSSVACLSCRYAAESPTGPTMTRSFRPWTQIASPSVGNQVARRIAGMHCEEIHFAFLHGARKGRFLAGYHNFNLNAGFRFKSLLYFTPKGCHCHAPDDGNPHRL